MAKTTKQVGRKGKKRATLAKPRQSSKGTRTAQSDSKGRVALGRLFANKMFRVSEQPDGNVLLEPVVTVHEREAWFFQNPEVQAMVQEGIRQSREGKGQYLGSFAEHADADIDDDED